MCQGTCAVYLHHDAVAGSWSSFYNLICATCWHVDYCLIESAGNNVLAGNYYAFTKDFDGYTYPSEYFSIKKPELASHQVWPGEKEHGWVCFVIPITATGLVFKYEIQNTVTNGISADVLIKILLNF